MGYPNSKIQKRRKRSVGIGSMIDKTVAIRGAIILAAVVLTCLSLPIHAAEETPPHSFNEVIDGTTALVSEEVAVSDDSESGESDGTDEPAAVAAPTVGGKLESVKSGESPLSITGVFETALHSGSTQYSYPLTVPPGTAGLVPSLSLTYNSGSARGRSDYLGQGWDMGVSYVLREDKNGTPDYASDDVFKLFLNGRSHDLMRIDASDRLYTEIESDLYIEYEPHGDGNQYKGYWLVRTPDGTSYRFGYNFDSEHVCSTRDYVTAWYLDEAVDTNGNHIYYSYAENPYPNDIGAIYPTRIEYNNDKSRVVEYVYETGDRPDKPTVYTEGCRTRMTRRLAEIRVSAGGELVRRYGLTYTPRVKAVGTLLTAITEYGRDGSALPPTEFSYAADDGRWNESHEIWAPVDTPFLDNTHVEMMDVNRDGLVDIVDGDIVWKVYLNTGSSWPAEGTEWLVQGNHQLGEADTELADVNNDGLVDIVEGEGWTFRINFNNGNGWGGVTEWPAGWDHNLEELDTQLIDVNGDGLVDILEGDGSTWYINFNNGNGWSSRVGWSAGSDHNLEESDTQVADVNGDGLPDIVEGEDTWTVNINNGSGWDAPQVWLVQQNHSLDEYDTALADVNGDGLVDIVEGDGESGWEVNLNSGDGWGSPITWLSDGPDFTSDVRLADANGNGFPDVVARKGGVGWKVHINQGNRGFLLTGIKSSYGGKIAIEYGPSTKLDNTGTDNVSDLGFNVWVVTRVTRDNGLTGPQQAVVTETYSYQDGLQDYQDEEFRGFHAVTATDNFGTSTQHLTYQDDALKGREERMEVRGPGGELYSETRNTYSSTPRGEGYIVRVTRTEQYTYDGVANDPRITAVEYTYDTYGNVTRTDFLGKVGVSGDERTDFAEYVANTDIWLVNLTKHTWRMAGGVKLRESWFYYDDHNGLDDPPQRGNLTRQVDWLSTAANPATATVYDAYGNPLSTTDPNGNTTTFAYDPTHTFVTQTTNARNQTTLATYDPGTGNMLSTTDPNGYSTTYGYDAFGRVIREVRPYDSIAFPTISYEYAIDGTAPEGVVVRQRTTAGQPAALNVYTFVDGFNRVLQTRAPAENNSVQIVTNTYYNDRGLVSAQSVPHLLPYASTYATPQTGIRATRVTYDPVGREIEVTNPDDTVRRIVYDHWRIDLIDENGHTISRYQDAYDNTIQVDEHNQGETYTTAYTYSGADELLSITDHEGNQFLWAYDSLGRQIQMDDPDLGVWTYTYDAAGNLTGQTDNRGITTTTAYDALNRITRVDYPTLTDTVYTYDQGTIGVLSAVQDAAGSVAYTYDQRLRQVREDRTMGGLTWTTRMAYDSADRVTSMIYPGGEVVAFAFNGQGQIESAGDYVTNYNYDAFNKITHKEYGNGVATDFTYSVDDFRLQHIQTPGIQDLSYEYDDAGNVTSITDGRHGTTETFQYDGLDRLVEATEPAGYSRFYTYNSIGNILAVETGVSQAVYAYGDGAGPHAVTSVTTTHKELLESGEIEFAASILAGESTPVSFDIRNKSGADLKIDRVLVVVRGPNCPTWECPNMTEFPSIDGIVLKPNESFTYAARRAFGEPGNGYLMQAYVVIEGGWQAVSEVTAFSISSGIEISELLVLSPALPAVGEMVNARYSVRNVGNRPISLPQLGVVARGPNCSGWDCPNGLVDFPFKTNLTLQPGQSFTYEATRKFSKPGGGYFAEAAFADTNVWWSPIAGGHTVQFSVSSSTSTHKVFMPSVSKWSSR